MMAKMSKKRMKRNVSQLLAVTRFTPYNMVRSSFPWDVLKPLRATNAIHPLSPAESNLKILMWPMPQKHCLIYNAFNVTAIENVTVNCVLSCFCVATSTAKRSSSPFRPGPVLLGGVCWTTLVPPYRTCSLPFASTSNTSDWFRVSIASC